MNFPGVALNGAHEAYLRVDYQGDVARPYLGGRLVADDFYSGRTWEIGLKHFMPQVLLEGLRLGFLPLRRDAPVYMEEEAWPDFHGEDELVRVKKIDLAVEYAFRIAPLG